jgi:hypothetical protein
VGDAKVVLVASKILKMPWERDVVPEVETSSDNSAVVAKAAAFVTKHVVAAGGAIDIPKIGAALYTDPEILADPDYAKIAAIVFSNDVKVILMANGITCEGINFIAAK